MKAKEIISKIYVDAHIKEFPNAVEYTGSLSPEKTKAVDSALLALKEMVLRLLIIKNCSCGDKYKCGCGVKRHNQAIDSVARLFEEGVG